MENDVFLKELKFGIGDGNLQYYVYNWKCPEMPSQKVSVLYLNRIFTLLNHYIIVYLTK